ncbi:E2F target protein 1 [Angomonas deanei]|uniref:Mini-chromosome maintenance replisome factor, putative n=1 Tax=Angomonas deanei TaxID=59799 RepID=A0A7G2C8Q4_9TRYP|nr:E2F target protein 1 [Angomonas deanei]CAD2215909.1 Mini-chromosome maintenance replisome factor, putative [Angomonas deanei]|eukprot:EPY27387.1 E2F target protein 1 [Angomonas deanei]
MLCKDNANEFLCGKLNQNEPINTVVNDFAALLLQQKHAATGLFSASDNGSFPASPNLSLCRGMIQDIQPEVSLFAVGKNDFFSYSGEDTSETAFLDATLLYVIPVPNSVCLYPGGTTESSNAALKRDREEMEGEQPLPAAKNVKHYLNLPHEPVSRGLAKGCIVTVLNPAGNSFKLNEIVDFYGYTHIEDPIDTSTLDGSETLDVWRNCTLSNSLVARFISFAHTPFHPTINTCLTVDYFASMRQKVIGILNKYLTNNDSLLSEMVLLHLCSKVIQHTGSTPLGDVPLLVSAGAISAKGWSAVLQRFLAAGETFVDGDAIKRCRTSLTPKYNVDENFLQTGLLQVGDGSHITFDCDNLSPTLTEGTSDLLFNLVHHQRLSVEYPYHKIDVPVDVGVLALTTKPQNLPLLFKFAFAVTANDVVPNPSPMSPAEAEEVQTYLNSVRQVEASFIHQDEVRDYLANQLVELSNAEEKWNNRDCVLHNNTFSVVAAVVRAHSLSVGCTSIDNTHIDYILSLEKARLSRNVL